MQGKGRSDLVIARAMPTEALSPARTIQGEQIKD